MAQRGKPAGKAAKGKTTAKPAAKKKAAPAAKKKPAPAPTKAKAKPAPPPPPPPKAKAKPAPAPAPAPPKARPAEPAKPAATPAEQRTRFVAAAREAGLARLASAIADSARPSIRLVATNEDAKALGSSRLGGLPDLPERTRWPRSPAHPLTFVGQLSLPELAPVDPTGLLPKEGLLSFFWDELEPAWGLDLAEKQRFRVLYTPAGLPLVRHNRPMDLVPKHKYMKVEYAPRPVRPVVELTLPFVRTAAYRAFGASEQETNQYMDRVYGAGRSVWPSGGSPYHRMLGHPQANQGDMARRIAYLFAGQYDKLDGPPDPALEEVAGMWRLLLQVDTDEQLGTNWGSGRLFFLIREDDLRARRFDAAWVQFQG